MSRFDPYLPKNGAVPVVPSMEPISYGNHDQELLARAKKLLKQVMEVVPEHVVQPWSGARYTMTDSSHTHLHRDAEDWLRDHEKARKAKTNRDQMA